MASIMSKAASEHVLAMIKASVSLVPYVGGSIASLIGDYIPTATQRSIETAIRLIKEQLETMGERIDPDAVNKDEFAELFKTCYLTVVRTHQQAKLRAVAALIANILLKDGDPDKLSYTELDHFARCVEALSIGAIEVLGRVVCVARQRDCRRFGEDNVRLDFSDIHRAMPNIVPDLLMGLLTELNAFHLVHLMGTPGVRTENYGNYPMEVPPIGVRFASRLLQLNAEGRTGSS